MRETHAGNKMPESKEEAKEVPKKVAHGKNIKIKYVTNAGYTEYFVDKYFDGVLNAEKEIFGGKDEYICSCCGKSFENRRVYNNHFNNCSKKKVKAVEKASKLISDFHIESEHYGLHSKNQTI